MIKSESHRALRCWPVPVCRGSAPNQVGTLNPMTTLEGKPGLRDGKPSSERLSHLLSRRASEWWTQPGLSGLCSAVSKDDDRGERGLGLEGPAGFKQVEREWHSLCWVALPNKIQDILLNLKFREIANSFF